ncbi:hypothetical protein CN947_18950 [Bacillus cereus]|nr:hypothetical protein CN947_18950 [Bacillus cereus]
MKEIKSYYSLLLSLNNIEEHWEIKLVRLSEGKFLGSAIDVQNNLYVSWTKLEATTEEEAYDKMVKLTQKNQL